MAAPGVLDNDEDEQNPDALNAVLVAAPAHGTLLLNGDGGFNYKPAPDFTGEDQFTYQATDGQFQSQAATVTIGVQSADAPAGTGDGASSGCFLGALIGPPQRQ